MNALEVLQKQKIIQRHIIKADAGGELPTRIQILRVVDLEENNVKRKPIKITLDDLLEMKSNFDKGIGVPGQGQTGLPVDFMHEDFSLAAAWIKALDVDPIEGALYATIEWSRAGEDAVKNKEFKCISPSFFPASLGIWRDPENSDITARNVLVGAGLTNIPFFKDLKPIMASNTSASSEEDNYIIYVASEKEKTMKLEDVVKKPVDTLTEEEKTFLSDNKDKLDASQLTQYGFEAPVEPAADPKLDAAARAKLEADVREELEPKIRKEVEASLKTDGKVVVEASVLEDLTKSRDKFERKEAEGVIEAHIGRGAIKADQRDKWVDRMVAASTEDRKMIEDTLNDLPKNVAMEGKKGEDVKTEASATETIQLKAQEKVEAAQKAGNTVKLGDAIAQVMKEDSDLAAQYAKETEVK